MVMWLAQCHCCFLVTSSRHVLAYTSMDDSFPAIVLSTTLFDRHIYSEKEFAVTVLHEILHWVMTMDQAADSKDEALHDLLCYQLLGFEIPADHWAREIEVTEEEAQELGFSLKEE